MALQPILGSVTGPGACAGLYTFVYPWNRLVWLVYVWVRLIPLERATLIGIGIIFAYRGAQADWLYALGLWGLGPLPLQPLQPLQSLAWFYSKYNAKAGLPLEGLHWPRAGGHR